MELNKMVIDGDNMKCLEYFNEADTDKVVEKYENLGIYDDVSIDCNGDIVLYREF